MRPLLACILALAAGAAVLVADDHVVIFDEDVDFSAFTTFAVGDAHVESARPELSFPAVARSAAAAVRATLSGKGLKEATTASDLVATVDVKGVDYAIGPFGRPNAIQPNPPGRRGRSGTLAVDFTELAVDFTEVTVVVDLNHGTPATLVWRGVYHDSEKDARRLAEALPKDTAALLAEYPPKKVK